MSTWDPHVDVDVGPSLTTTMAPSPTSLAQVLHLTSPSYLPLPQFISYAGCVCVRVHSREGRARGQRSVSRVGVTSAWPGHAAHGLFQPRVRCLCNILW